MRRNELQNYLDENFPELKIIVHNDPADVNGSIIGFRTDVRIRFYSIPGFNDDNEKYYLLFNIEDMLYNKIGLLNKAVDDVRKLRRELTS